jgi:hypothetical protein
VLALLVLAASAYGVVDHVLVKYGSAVLDQRYADTWDSLPALTRWWYAASNRWAWPRSGRAGPNRGPPAARHGRRAAALHGAMTGHGTGGPPAVFEVLVSGLVLRRLAVAGETEQRQTVRR